MIAALVSILRFLKSAPIENIQRNDKKSRAEAKRMRDLKKLQKLEAKHERDLEKLQKLKDKYGKN